MACRACLIGVLCAVLLGFAVPLRAAGTDEATETFNSLYGADLARVRGTGDVRDDVELAARLLAAAKRASGQPAFVTVLCEKAYDLALRHPTGYGTALEAMGLLARTVPAKADACAARTFEIREKQFDAARGDEKKAAGELLLGSLLPVIEAEEQAGDLAEAAALYRKAKTIAAASASPRADEIDARAEALAQQMKTAARIADVKALLARDPANVSAREGLVRLYLVDLDDPAEAAKHLEGAKDPSLLKYVPAAAKGVEAAPEFACLELGEWYRDLAAKAPSHAREAMYEKAKAYLRRFLQMHTPQDLSRTRATLALEKVQEAVAKLTAPSGVKTPTAARQPAKRVPWPRVFAFGTSRSLLFAQGAATVGEAFETLTVEAWLKPSGRDGTIFELGGYGNGLDLRLAEGHLRFTVTRSRTPHVVQTALPGSPQWFHVAAQFDSGQASLWVNGKPAASRTISSSRIPTRAEPGALGAGHRECPSEGGKDHPGFAGQVAVFRISSVARYRRPFNPRPDLPADPSTLYYLSPAPLPTGPVPRSGIKDRARRDSGTIWVPNGEVEVVAPGDSETAATATPATEEEAAPELRWADLIPLVDPVKDAVSGTWRRQGATLVLVGPAQEARLGLPVLVQGNYELQVNFVRTSGDDTIAIMLPVGSAQVGLKLGFAHGKASGLDMIHGRGPADNETTVKPAALQNGREYRARIKVLLENQDAHIAIHLDGEPYIEWRGALSALSLHHTWSLHERGCLGLGASNSVVAWRSARLRMLSGEARLLRPAGR